MLISNLLASCSVRNAATREMSISTSSGWGIGTRMSGLAQETLKGGRLPRG
jgi:hypothetical protein